MYCIQGVYDRHYGFETVTSEETLKEARERLKEYRKNEPGIPFRIVKIEED
jgi:DNA polymerase IIIc chi subunit